MRPFNLEEYLKNPERKIITRDGRKVKRVLCTDVKNKYSIVAVIENHDGITEQAISVTKEGKYFDGNSNDKDLFFASEKHEGWATIYGKFLTGEIFSTKEEAEESVKRCGTKDFVAIAKIEWKE